MQVFDLPRVKRQVDELWQFVERHHGKWVTAWEVNFLDEIRTQMAFTRWQSFTVHEIYVRLLGKNLL